MEIQSIGCEDVMTRAFVLERLRVDQIGTNLRVKGMGRYSQ